MRVFGLKNKVIVTHKTFLLIVILVLSLIPWTIGAFATTCDEGQYWPGSRGNFPKIPQENIVSVFYSYPSEPQEQVCHLHTDRVPHTQTSFPGIFHNKQYSPDDIHVVGDHTFSMNPLQNEYKRQFHVTIRVHPTPIYLQRHALLC